MEASVSPPIVEHFRLQESPRQSFSPCWMHHNFGHQEMTRLGDQAIGSVILRRVGFGDLRNYLPPVGQIDGEGLQDQLGLEVAHGTLLYCGVPEEADTSEVQFPAYCSVERLKAEDGGADVSIPQGAMLERNIFGSTLSLGGLLNDNLFTDGEADQFLQEMGVQSWKASGEPAATEGHSGANSLESSLSGI